MSAPTMQHQLELEAYTFGGQALVDVIHAEARETVDELYPWNGTGDEPAERVSAYEAVWWQRVDLARAEPVGQYVTMADGQTVMVGPARCPLGHVLGRDVVAVWEDCSCPGHMTWTCRERVVGMHECGAVVYYPAAGEGCRVVVGQWLKYPESPSHRRASNAAQTACH